MSAAYVASLQRRLRSLADAATAAGTSKYFKEVLPCYGVKAPALREAFGEEWRAGLGREQPEVVKRTAMQLLRLDHAEEKNVGALCLARVAKQLTAEDVDALGDLVNTHVFDWATADSLAGRVRAPPTRWASCFAPNVGARAGSARVRFA